MSPVILQQPRCILREGLQRGRAGGLGSSRHQPRVLEEKAQLHWVLSFPIYNSNINCLKGTWRALRERHCIKANGSHYPVASWLLESRTSPMSGMVLPGRAVKEKNAGKPRSQLAP